MLGWLRTLLPGGKRRRRRSARPTPNQGGWLSTKLWGPVPARPVSNARMLDDLKREEARQAREAAKRAAHIARMQALERRRDHAVAVAQARALGQPPPEAPRIMRGGPHHGEIDQRRIARGPAGRASATNRRAARAAQAPGDKPVPVKGYINPISGKPVKKYHRALPGQGKGK